VIAAPKTFLADCANLQLRQIVHIYPTMWLPLTTHRDLCYSLLRTTRLRTSKMRCAYDKTVEYVLMLAFVNFFFSLFSVNTCQRFFSSHQHIIEVIIIWLNNSDFFFKFHTLKNSLNVFLVFHF
jgi:hypothetical protein